MRGNPIQVIETIPDEIYQQAREFNDFTIYHTSRWHRFLQNVFGWRVRAIISRNSAGDLCWFLPFVRKMRMTNRIRVSLPLSHRIGAAWREGWTHQPDLTSLAPLEIHESVELPHAAQVSSNYITRLYLTEYANQDALFDALHKSSIQRKITKAQKNDLVVQTTANDATLDDFYHLQAVTRQRQGVPMYPSQFFRKMHQILTDDQFKLYTAYIEGEIVAGIVFLHFQDVAIYGYGAVTGDRDVLRTGVNQLIMWRAIQAAYDADLSVVDFGTTPKHLDGLLNYKDKWAAKSTELPYTYVLQEAQAPTVDRESSMVNIAKEVLQQLPLPVFKRLSPLLLRLAV